MNWLLMLFQRLIHKDCHNRAKWAAIFYTILANAELNGLEPMSYLKELLKILPDYPVKELENLLPVNWEKIFKSSTSFI